MSIDLEAIKARAEAATPGTWVHIPPPTVDGTIHKVRGSESGMPILSMTDTGYTEAASWERRRADATFIAHARTDVPALVAEVERLLGLVAGLESHHHYHHENWMPKP